MGQIWQDTTFCNAFWRNEMDEKPKPSDPPEKDQPLDEKEAEAILEQKRRQNTSGLSWDEVAKEDKKGWREITEMGEGD
jgi:hypothetical protein